MAMVSGGLSGGASSWSSAGPADSSGGEALVGAVVHLDVVGVRHVERAAASGGTPECADRSATASPEVAVAGRGRPDFDRCFGNLQGGAHERPEAANRSVDEPIALEDWLGPTTAGDRSGRRTCRPPRCEGAPRARGA